MKGRRSDAPYAGLVHLSLVTVVVDDYDTAIGFFTGVLGFELAADAPAQTTDGRAKRWVVVRPPGAATGLLLARADGADQAAVVGQQAAGRVGFKRKRRKNNTRKDELIEGRISEEGK